MRKLIGVCLALSGLYGGYWFVGQTAVERGLAAWFDDRRADGWVAEYATLETKGFPRQFDTVITQLQLADPATGIAWTAPEFHIQALSYQPQHYDAIWPASQTIANPTETFTITSDQMRAAVVFVPGPSFTLNTSEVVIDNLLVTSSAGSSTAMRKLQFSTERSGTVENGHILRLNAAGYKPDLGRLKIIDPQDSLPDEIDGLTLDVTIGFDAPWDRSAIEKRRPQPTRLDLARMKATWGQLDLELAGTLVIDAEGIPEGEILIRAKNWREIIELLVNLQILPADYKTMVERTIGVVSALSGDPNNLDAPLGFHDGSLSFGPIPLGDVPVIRLR